MEAEVVEGLARPLLDLAGSEMTPLACDTQRAQPLPDVGIELVEALGRIPRAEVVAPPPQHGVQVGENRAEVRVTSTAWGQLPALRAKLRQAAN